jgi:hypothetical protein
MNYTFELNNAKRDSQFATGQVNAKSPVVEVFSALVKGEEIAKFGAKGDKAVKYIQDLATKAAMGDQMSISEINEIRKFVIQPKLLQEIKLLGIFGSYTPLAWGDTAYLEKITYNNVKADIQAEGQDVSTAFKRKSKTSIASASVSARRTPSPQSKSRTFLFARTTSDMAFKSSEWFLRFENSAA